MHELSIAISLLDLAEEEAERRGVQVIGLRLRLGPLSGVVKEALLSAYELAREDSSLPNAVLEIEETRLIVYCPQCQKETPPQSLQEIWCPDCRTPTPDIVSGRELELVALEVVDGIANAPG